MLQDDMDGLFSDSTLGSMTERTVFRTMCL